MFPRIVEVRGRFRVGVRVKVTCLLPLLSPAANGPIPNRH